MKVLYTGIATATGGRDGKVKSSDGLLDFELKMPKELGGPGGAYTNPEQLFAAGYSACFDGALNLSARLQKVSIGATSVAAEISIGRLDSGGLGLAAKLNVHIQGVSQTVAEALVAEAHKVCPYSNATRGNIEVAFHVTVSYIENKSKY